MNSQNPNRIEIERVAECGVFRHLTTIPGIRHDLKYAGTDNFACVNLYGAHDCAWLHREAADALERAAQFLARHDASLHLRVLDALRPHRVQEAMWAHLKDTPLKIYLADPLRGSIHSYGMAIDVTIARRDGTWLDMGSGFDELAEVSHPEFEARFLSEGTLTQKHISHRQLLRDTMAAGGFHGITTEWWHFDCGDRAHVRKTYLRVD